jgi:Xaa-Pro aminopeptidase
MNPASATTENPSSFAPEAPFDTRKLDGLLEERDIDALIVSSKHNIQYLLGGYRFFFFDYMDAIGLSRYLPLFIYPRGRPEDAAYIANSMESYERSLGRFWVPNVVTKSWGTLDAANLALDHLERLNQKPRRVGVETSFLPADAYSLITSRLHNTELVDCLVPLERLRARKNKAELDLLRRASEGVVESMLAVMSSHGPGVTKRELAEALRREEVSRGLIFEYCLVTTGANINRAPSTDRWLEGEIMSLDSGGNYHGYIGDLCRMAILGEPDAELQNMLGGIEEVQQAARKPIRAGAIGSEIYAAAEAVLARDPRRPRMHFCAHGMGLVSHEAPRLTSTGPVPYPGDDAERPLEEGMVISIETTLPHPKRGFIKLEDTVAVTANGYEAFGDAGRGWNRGGARKTTPSLAQ